MLVVDANVALRTPKSRRSSRSCRKAGVPVLLVANKVDDVRGELEGGPLESRTGRAVAGVGAPWPR